MATCWLRGSASFTWTPPGGSGTVQHLLAVPLSPGRELVPSVRKRRFDWFADDFASREVVTVGSGVSEVVASIRMDDEPAELMALLGAALDHDLTLDYRWDESGEVFPVRVVEVLGGSPDEVALTGDRDRFGGGEWEVRVRLRRTDGGSLAGMLEP